VTGQLELQASRRRLLADSAGIAVSALGFGFVYGLSAREAGFLPIEAMAMSVIVFAGAAQFAAVGYIASGLAWPGIILLTALLNARHLLYSAALRPWLKDVPLPRRALIAHLLTDEAWAFNAAFVIPELSLGIVVASGVAAPFVPMFMGLRRENEPDAQTFGQTILTLAVLAMGVVSLSVIPNVGTPCFLARSTASTKRPAWARAQGRGRW